jgi:hypothetical protein
MIKRQTKLTFVILGLLSFNAFSQSEYFATDSMTSVGIKLIDGGDIDNSRFCQVKQGERVIRYSPREVKEFKFKDGRIYFSRNIKIDNEEKKVFLERLNEGSINLYYYKAKKEKLFLIEKDSGQLIIISQEEINNRTYKDSLNYYTKDCDNVSDALKLIKYNKRSLSKFTKQYNSCVRRPFPFIRYGLIIGYGTTRLTNSKISDAVLKNAVFNTDKSFSLGLFMDVPIILSYFSLHPEIYYQKNAFSSHSVSFNSRYDIIINSTSINVPILLRYTYPLLNYRPFINFGGSFLYNFRNNNAIYTSTINDNVIEIEELKNINIYSEKQFGYSLGGGIQYNLDFRKSIFVELRYNNLYGLTDETYGNNSFLFIIGLNL